MELFIHKNRNVVVKRAGNGDKAQVAFVGVAEHVEGSKRRGRHPDYSKPVKNSELVALETPSAEWVQMAEAALNAPVSHEDASGTVETSNDTPDDAAWKASHIASWKAAEGFTLGVEFGLLASRVGSPFIL